MAGQLHLLQSAKLICRAAAMTICLPTGADDLLRRRGAPALMRIAFLVTQILTDSTMAVAPGEYRQQRLLRGLPPFDCETWGLPQRNAFRLGTIGPNERHIRCLQQDR